MKVLALVIALLGVGSSQDVQTFAASPCLAETHCTCQMEEGLVDLRPLADVPVMSANGIIPSSFSFNPCKDFTQGGCKNVLMCENFPLGIHITVGTVSNVKFTQEKNGVALYYQTGLKKATVDLVCDENAEDPKFRFLSEPLLQPQHYYFRLTSKHVCPNPNITVSTTTTEPSTTTSNSSTDSTTTGNTTETTTHEHTSESTTDSTTTPGGNTTHTVSPHANTTVTATTVTPTTVPANSTATSTPNTPTTGTTPPTTTQGSDNIRSYSLGVLVVLALVCRRLI